MENSKKFNIVFMGTSDFGVPSLEAIAKSEHNLQAVVTLKDRKAGRGQKMIPTAIKQSALGLGCEVIEVDSPKEEFLYNRLLELKPDLIIVIAFRILPDSILSIPTIGSINLHASLLPKFRGPAPINWAIINGEKQSGNTIFFLDSGIDTGKIIAHSVAEITENMTTGDLYSVLMNQGPELILKGLKDIASGNIVTEEQDESVACKAPKLFKEDSNIDFSKDVQTVHNQIRGMNPFPGSYTFFNGKLLKVLSSEVNSLSGENNEIGKIISASKDGLVVSCKTGSIKLTCVAPEGKKPMDIASFVNGYKPEVGAFLTKES